MSWRGFVWTGTPQQLTQANQQHAARMARIQARAAELKKAVLLAKGRV